MFYQSYMRCPRVCIYLWFNLFICLLQLHVNNKNFALERWFITRYFDANLEGSLEFQFSTSDDANRVLEVLGHGALTLIAW